MRTTHKSHTCTHPKSKAAKAKRIRYIAAYCNSVKRRNVATTEDDQCRSHSKSADDWYGV